MKEGEVILVKLDRVEVETRIIKGIQRLPCCPYLDELVRNGILDLNDLMVAHSIGKIGAPTLTWVLQNIGMSVCCYLDMKPGAEIQNPLWEKS